MSTDRELLELAAKAYWGDEIDDIVSVEWGEQDNAILFTHADNQDHNGIDRTFCWNPLADDGDALRLAVKLRLDIRCRTSSARGADAFTWIEGGDDTDPCAATRRAIVRAAAIIGEGMESPTAPHPF